jgi:hypothetical protein
MLCAFYYNLKKKKGGKAEDHDLAQPGLGLQQMN